jgi:hypothetical protein
MFTGLSLVYTSVPIISLETLSQSGGPTARMRIQLAPISDSIW